MKLKPKPEHLHKVHHLLNHLHHAVEAVVAIGVSCGIHYIEVSASGILAVVCVSVLVIEATTS
jgi:hypothetical protein